MNYFERATALMPELVENRRYFHTNAEVGVHNPKARFNEDVLPIGASCLAHCAQQWLKNNK